VIKMKKKLKHVFMPNVEEINEQVLTCMDDIVDAIRDYHIAIRYTALKRIVIDEENILKNEYKFKDDLKPRKKEIKPPDSNMVI